MNVELGDVDKSEITFYFIHSNMDILLQNILEKIIMDEIKSTGM